jgi:VanZ family protein
VLKRVFLFAALFWTGVILYFCLENAKNIPQINIPYLDKFIHLGFHYGFVTLWFLYLKKKYNSTNYLYLLVFVLLASFSFGMSIELMQEYFTTTRSANLFDVLANIFGAILAAFSIILLNTYNGLINKI